jgi:hypothetical protein
MNDTWTYLCFFLQHKNSLLLFLLPVSLGPCTSRLVIKNLKCLIYFPLVIVTLHWDFHYSGCHSTPSDSAFFDSMFGDLNICDSTLAVLTFAVDFLLIQCSLIHCSLL